jgi:glycosyltransferase involved in cell wall biosynthesis
MKLADSPTLRDPTVRNGPASPPVVSSTEAVHRQPRPASTRPPHGRDARRIAYLTTFYPLASHAFIEREVTALRARGLEIETFAIRRSGSEHLLAARDFEAAATTRTLLPVSLRRFLADNASLLASHPHRYPSSLVRALSLGRGSRGRLWQAFYFFEAVLLARHCTRTGAGHIHAHFGHPSADVAMLAARLLGVPWSLTLHGTDVNLGDRRLLAAKVRDAAFVVCVGRFARDQVLSLVDPSESDKIRVVRCGLDATWFEAHEREAASAERIRLLSVARFEPPKEPAVLVDAVAELRRRGRQVELTLVGDGPLRPQLEQRIRQHELISSVTLAGFVGQDRIESHYRNAGAFCLSSSSEGVPAVLMEAMACQVPVIAPRLPGVEELVEHERTGLLFEAGDAVALAQCVERLASEAGLRERLVETARAKVEADFRIERSAAELEALFLSAERLSPSRPARRLRGRSDGRDQT